MTVYFQPSNFLSVVVLMVKPVSKGGAKAVLNFWQKRFHYG
jgi:hypothetical protein